VICVNKSSITTLCMRPHMQGGVSTLEAVD
jgi:hypothetical protein